MQLSLELARGLVRRILESPRGLPWSAQGLGMLRLYLDKDQRYRLHIWDSSLRTPNVSPIHDHPWHLLSYVVSGQLRQQRFLIAQENEPGYFDTRTGALYPVEELKMSFIKCGEGACTKTDPIKVHAYRTPVEYYLPGHEYAQRKDEVHESLAESGTVTIIDRTFEGDRDTARVFWRGDGGWVDAAPRRATDEEIARVTARALEGF